jgi:hypothetical protein
MAELPSEEDLKKLPLRAIVAYAARAGRRVQPIYQEASRIKDHKRLSQHLDKTLTASLLWANSESETIESYSHDAAYAGNMAKEYSDDAAAVGMTVYSASSATFNAMMATGTDDSEFTTYVADCAHGAAFDASFIGVCGIVAANADYQKLLSMNLSEDDTIDASENGPLGPYWPEELEPYRYKKLYPKMRALLDDDDE